VVVFGPRPLDAMATRSDALVALGKIVDPKAKKARRGALGWTRYVVTLARRPPRRGRADVVSVGGQRLAVTGRADQQRRHLGVSAAVLAETPTGKQVKAEAAKDALVPPGLAAAAKRDPGRRATRSRAVSRRASSIQQTWGDESRQPRRRDRRRADRRRRGAR